MMTGPTGFPFVGPGMMQQPMGMMAMGMPIGRNMGMGMPMMPMMGRGFFAQTESDAEPGTTDD